MHARSRASAANPALGGSSRDWNAAALRGDALDNLAVGRSARQHDRYAEPFPHRARKRAPTLHRPNAALRRDCVDGVHDTKFAARQAQFGKQRAGLGLVLR